MKLYSESVSPLALFSDVDAKFLHGTFVVMNDGMMNLFMILRPGWAGMRLLAPAHGLGDEWRPVIGQWPGSRDLIGSHSVTRQAQLRLRWLSQQETDTEDTEQQQLADRGRSRVTTRGIVRCQYRGQ